MSTQQKPGLKLLRKNPNGTLINCGRCGCLRRSQCHCGGLPNQAVILHRETYGEKAKRLQREAQEAK